MLNDRQKKIFSFLIEFISKNQYPPTVRDIVSGTGVKSTSTVSSDLKVLQNEGYIDKDDSKSRSIEILKDIYGNDLLVKEETIDIPLLGRVAAGNPIEAIEHFEYNFPIPAFYSKYGKLFMLEISGESMIEAGILDGDKVIVKQQNVAKHGEIVIAMIDGEATCKRLYNQNGNIMLIPENSTMEPIIPVEMTILGIVVGLYRDYL